MMYFFFFFREYKNIIVKNAGSGFLSWWLVGWVVGVCVCVCMYARVR